MRHHAWIPTSAGDAPLRRLDLAGGRASINQRNLRRHGLGGWQAATTAGLLTAWELTPQPGTFLDVGANAGVYALLCRLLWPSMHVIAFEPSADTVRAGRRWAAANDVDVAFEQVALSDTDGQGRLHLSSRSDASHSLEAGFRRSSGSVPVELARLDTYAERHGLRPTVAKIDVEQHELAVLRGGRRTLETAQPVVVMELLRSGSSKKAHRLLRRLGYTPHRLGARDCLFWPGAPPSGWEARFQGWLTAVERCVPGRAR